MSNRYRLITGLSAAVIIVAVLLCCCFVSFNNINDVFAFTTSNITSGAVDIGDILLEGYEDRTDGKVFERDKMTELYTKLTGDANKSSISDVDALGSLTSQDIRDRNDGKDIVLTMNKRQWTVTHLTKDKSGNTIATLWMTSNPTSLKWNNWGAHTPTSVYPSNMYSSSSIRAYGLNMGSGYAASEGATTLTKITQQG